MERLDPLLARSFTAQTSIAASNNRGFYEDIHKLRRNNTQTLLVEGITWTNRIGSACNLLRVTGPHTPVEVFAKIPQET